MHNKQALFGSEVTHVLHHNGVGITHVGDREGKYLQISAHFTRVAKAPSAERSGTAVHALSKPLTDEKSSLWVAKNEVCNRTFGDQYGRGPDQV